MAKMKPSPYQKAIFDFIKNETGSLIVEAVAGSGKTTTIVGALKKIDSNKRIIFCAFNKSIKLELEERVPTYVTVVTLNGLGHRAWMRHVGGSINLNSNKTFDILKSEDFETTYGMWAVRKARSKVRRMVGLAKSCGLVPEGNDEAQGLVPDTIETWFHLIEHHDIDFSAKEHLNKPLKEQQQAEYDAKIHAIEMARECLQISLDMWNEIDFDDQLYLPVVFGAKFPPHDFVFVDEAQDVAAIQRVMLKRTVAKKGGRLIAVGDPHQAIYGFRGADSQSLANIGKDFNAITLPLSISYRCPKNVVAEAQKYVSHIQSHESAPDGAVTNLGSYDPETMSQFEENDFVLCRNVAPLVNTAFALLRKGKPAVIVGRDIGKNLIALIERLGGRNISDFIDKLDEWKAKEVRKILDKDPEESTHKIDEKHECVMVFVRCSGASTVPALIEVIDKMFSDDNVRKAVRLSTIHKSKGLEAKRVLMLDSWLLPSKYAKKEWQKEQENNLCYVAITRAQETLAYVQTPKKVGF